MHIFLRSIYLFILQKAFEVNEEMMVDFFFSVSYI